MNYFVLVIRQRLRHVRVFSLGQLQVCPARTPGACWTWSGDSVVRSERDLLAKRWRSREVDLSHPEL